MNFRDNIIMELDRMDLKKNLGGRGNTSLDKKQHVSFRLYPEQVEILDKLAEELGRNRTEILECFIGLFGTV